MHHCASSLYTRELKVIVLYQPFPKTALFLAPHHHPCLPCQREVDWRQGTSCCFVAFACDMSVFFIHQTFLPSRRRDCHTTHRLYIFSVSYISKYNCVIKNRRESTSLPRLSFFIQYVNHSPVCSPAHQSASGTALQQARCTVLK